jgi:hypothetical protein
MAILAPAWTTAGAYIVLFKMVPILGKNPVPSHPKPAYQSASALKLSLSSSKPQEVD